MNPIHGQPPDIAQGSTAPSRANDEDEVDKIGAGDQGMMFGYASDETDACAHAHQHGAAIAEPQRSGKLGTLAYLRPDGKTQVICPLRGDDRPVEVTTIVVSRPSTPRTWSSPRFARINQVIRVLDDEGIKWDDATIYVNPTGRFVVGGPMVTPASPVARSSSTPTAVMGRHGGGAFSGKDPTKVDRSAAYLPRAGLPRTCRCWAGTSAEYELAYAIGASPNLVRHD